ncbi:hypothetical protein AX15_007469 [Amanita polypyramis BW_CC]|nr:hypothetical protein AX15_007469 [Amanita polypyramis BW_CC]
MTSVTPIRFTLLTFLEHPQMPTLSSTDTKTPCDKDVLGDSSPSRNSRAFKPVAPPLSGVSLHRFIYTLFILVSVIGAYYSFRLVQYKTEIGGWWNLALGRSPSHVQQQRDRASYAYTETKQTYSGGAGTVEHGLNQLAEALGIPSTDLADAIASAVKDHVPPASLSSIAAKETGRAVRILINRNGSGRENDDSGFGKASSNVIAGSEGAANIVEGVVSGMGRFVGMDEP